MNKDAKIYVAGHQGLVGSALVRKLQSQGYGNLILKTSRELDLRQQTDVEAFFMTERPEYVFLAAAKVGGILANDTYKAEFIYDNIMIAANVIHAAYSCKAQKLLNLGSSCIYPKFSRQPMKEEYLLTGTLEQTNEPYAIAKIAAIKLCRYYNEQYGTNFISVMPTNLYGPYDNFNLETSHVLPALIRRFHEARISGLKNVTVWGTGEPFREFLHVDDLADACVFLMQHCNYHDIGEFINIGTGTEIQIRELAEMVKKIVDFRGAIHFDDTKPDGTPRKLLDVTRLNKMGWVHKIQLEAGIQETYQWYLSRSKAK